MLLGRFFMIIPLLAMGGTPGRRKKSPRKAWAASRYPELTFTVLLIGTVVVVGALTFLPALAMGPIVEHFLMSGSGVTY